MGYSRTVYIILCLLMLVVTVAGCVVPATAPTLPQTPPPASLPAPAPRPTPTPVPKLLLGGPPPEPPVRVGAVSTQLIYFPGEKVQIEFSFANTTADLFTLAPFPPQVEIRRARPYESIHSFPAGKETRLLNLGEVVKYAVVWDQKDLDGNQVFQGWYFVDLEHITVTGGSRTHGMSFSTITRFLVQFPQGAMEKTIELDQSRTVNGITITLKSIKLSSMSVEVWGFMTPPGYIPNMRPIQHMYRVKAEYIADGVTRDAGYSGIGFETDGVRISWGDEPVYLDPIPSDTKELVFRITSLDDYRGPWEFRIPLR